VSGEELEVEFHQPGIYVIRMKYHG
jgi:hypothetical protein